MSMRSAFGKLPHFIQRLKPKKDTEFTCSATNNTFMVAFDDYGDPERKLYDKLEPVRRPLFPSDVLVKMLMAPVNVSDLEMITGTYFVRPQLPAVAGNEGVGQVMEIGTEVERFRPGDWVIPADLGWGTWRTVAVTEEKNLIRVPNDIPVLGAATVAVNPCTAYRMLKTFIDLRPGDAIIQNGANSSVGQAVIQLAKEWGYHTINIVRNRDDIESLVMYLRDIGAHHVVTDQFLKSGDMRYFINSLPKRPRLALDCIGGKISNELPQYLADDAVMVTYGHMAHQIECSGDCGTMISPVYKQVHVQGYWDSTWEHGHAPCMKKMVAEICSMMKKGKFRPPPCDIYTLDMYPLAVKLAKEPFRRRKVVLRLAGDLTL
ncbi:hypothetical protein BaRGS_00006933 [Batillaria attramentaria]|uniref:Enoyl-[acyl-carrier-protein] reductase, mitochondrial n=1 Tax=Batillaria attramentaria TaxID=370345 RepID=A0ABD0LR68_9CAEN